MKSSATLAPLLENFFTQRLMNQRQASPHTIGSYRDTFRMLLRFAQQRLHQTPARLPFEAIDAPMIAAFLDDLEKSRGITARTRNLRLTAIRSFFQFCRLRRAVPCLSNPARVGHPRKATHASFGQFSESP